MKKILGIFVFFINAFLYLCKRSGRLEEIVISWDFVVKKGDGNRTALFLHRVAPLLWRFQDKRFLYHSIDWESAQLAESIIRRGYKLSGIRGWSEVISRYKPKKKFDMIFDENGNLPLFNEYLNHEAIKILYLTGSYPRFQNEMEIKRIKDLWTRRGERYHPKRFLKTDMFDVALEMADACLVVGNHITKGTYPQKFHDKIYQTTISASPTYKKHERYVPEKREFLWFFGEGAVHKGLDLTIEAFAMKKDWTLNIIGPFLNEQDFCKIYSRELSLPNIRMHGYMSATSEKFSNIINDCVGFIAPSCSEGISPAVATCLQAGMYPIISRNTGITLPEDSGIYLETCSVQEIEQAVEEVKNMEADSLTEQIILCQSYANERYSRDNYRKDINKFFDRVISDGKRASS